LICDYFCTDDVAYVSMGMMATIFHQKPLSAAKAVSEESQCSLCGWLVNQLEQKVDQSFSVTSQLNREKLWMSFYQLKVSRSFQDME